MCLHVISTSSNDHDQCVYISYLYQAIVIINVSISYIVSYQARMINNVFYLISTSNNHLIVYNVLFLALNPMIFVITEPNITKNWVQHKRDDVRGEMIYIFIMSHYHPHHTSIFITHLHHHLHHHHLRYS